MEGLSSTDIGIGRIIRVPSTIRFLGQRRAVCQCCLCWWQTTRRIRVLAKSRTIFGGGASTSTAEMTPIPSRAPPQWNARPRLSVTPRRMAASASLAECSPRWLSSACRETVNCQVPANQQPRCRHPPSSLARSMCSHFSARSFRTDPNQDHTHRTNVISLCLTLETLLAFFCQMLLAR